MKCKALVCLVLLYLCSLAGDVNGAAAWKKVKETHDGIAIYMRSVAKTTVKEIKVNLRIDLPPRFVLDAACDPKSFKDSTKYVEINQYYWIGDPDVWFTYQLVNYPVVDKRDYVMRWERTLDPKKGIYRLSFGTSNQRGPGAKRNVIRVTLATGSMEVVPRDGGAKSLLRFRLLADPGGSIPGWIMNIANKVNVPDIIREIRSAAYTRARQCATGNCRYWDALGPNR